MAGLTPPQATIGILIGIALVVAIGRTIIRARTFKSHGLTIDDGFFLLAVITFVAGIVITYIDMPRWYLQEYVAAGLAIAPPDYIPYLIYGERLEDAVTSLIGATIVSIKFSFLFFFRGLLRQQRKLLIWWWCIFAVLIPTAFIMLFAIFVVCAYWNQEIFVKCATPASFRRQNAVLKSITIIDIFTDAFLISIPVLLLWNVQISIRRKLALGGILCLSACTMIISIIKVAGGNTTDGGVDTSWVLFWYEIEAAIAIIVVSVSAFRALFIAHQAMKYRSPAENGSSWNIWSRKSKGSRPEELPVPPAQVLGGVSTHIRGSQYGAGDYDRGDYDMGLPLHGPGIIVTQDIRSEKTSRQSGTKSSAESFV
ncbi:hypothetical protein BDR22DRAFT_920939 [Usnea florida]